MSSSIRSYANPVSRVGSHYSWQSDLCFSDGWIRVFSRVGSGSVSLGSDPNLDFSVRSEFLDAGIRVFLKGRIRISFIRIRNLDFVYIGNLRICRVIYQCALGCPLHRNIFFKLWARSIYNKLVAWIYGDGFSHTSYLKIANNFLGIELLLFRFIFATSQKNKFRLKMRF